MTRTTRRISWTLLCGVTGAMLMGSAAQAQDPGAPGGPPPGYSGPPTGAPGAPGTGDAALSNVTNETVTTTTTTTDVDPLAATDVTAEPLPNTGGEPLLMSMLGTMMAGGAFMLRRKVR